MPLGVGSWRLGVALAALVAVVVAGQQPPAPVPLPQQPSDIGVRITGDPGAPPRYAVPDFVALNPEAAEIAKMLGQVLWDDLNFEHDLYMIPRDTYSSVRSRGRPRRFRLPRGGSSEPMLSCLERFKHRRHRPGPGAPHERAVAPIRVCAGVQRQRAQSAALRAHGRERGALAATRSEGCGAHPADLLFRSQSRAADWHRSEPRRQGDLRRGLRRREPDAHHHEQAFEHQPVVVTGRARAIAYTSYKAIEPIFSCHSSIRESCESDQGSGQHFLPVYSPDGSRIAFASNRDGNMRSTR